ncbi:helix-turn-helix domain-containing protein [Methylomarinovum tepidoasis]|nr:helix-turn-helix domain-containing protein [Methylomarinovum sp. IN45]
MPSPLITPEEAARMLGVSPRTLATWRCLGRYRLPYVKIGARVRYRQEDVEAFIERRTREHTGEAA